MDAANFEQFRQERIKVNGKAGTLGGGIITIEKGFLSDILSKIRWATANSALGLNPKVLVTQTLSLAAGIAEFNPKYVTKGLGHFFGEKEKVELSKYSPLMWERMQVGNSIDIAEIREMSIYVKVEEV